MPRKHKSKHCKKQNQQASQDGDDSCKMLQAAATTEKPPSFSSSGVKSNPKSSSASDPTHTSQASCRAPTISITSSDALHTKSAKSQDEEHSYSSEVLSLENTCRDRDPLTVEVKILQKFVMYKYRVKQIILHEDMVNIIDRKYRRQFPEIFKRACASLEELFAVELKAADTIKPAYELVSKLKLPNKGRVRPGRGLPKTGLLMNVLGVVFINGNCASEEEVWNFLNSMRVFSGRRHYMYGEPRKLITKDLVKLEHLEYHQVPNTDLPCYKFLWGPKAYTETTKMKVLEFWAKLNEKDPTDFPLQYDEALREELERVRAKWAARNGTGTKCRKCSMACSTSVSTASKI
ncbi:PREDICTED: melanoma-associated antigen B5 [Myotis davidii]|uniref:Melanoma-associated antigen B3 n=1 Tax=Myotis davidii TaxID=225400 RepID=L5LI19_MYODS|nr:PREDICTED: melanoma-associated antigen B5 [Myotis davidii]ELK25298.1 Melanoma-associated antigen B3 [Myotis davidii]